MGKAKNKSSDLSGISIGLGFVALGLVFGYWLTDTYGSWTKYIAAALILFGTVGFFIEVQKRITSKSFRFDNLGIGLLLLIPSVYGVYVIDNHLGGWVRGAGITLLAGVMLVGLMALIDMVVSIFEELVKSDNLKDQVKGFLQFFTLIITSAAAIFAAVKQLLQ